MGSRNNKPGRIVKGTALQPTLKSASGVWSLDEAMQAHRVNAWPQPNLFQPVANSLRNSLGKTGYISREAPGRSGSQRKFTFSWWLKKNSNATSSQQHLFYSYDGSRLLQIFFERGGNTNPDCICVYGGGTDLRFTPVLRDVSAWYNIVIAVDIDQSTSANTIKCWINGIQITTVGTQFGSPGTPSYPTSATNWPINQAGVYQRIGGNADGGTMDGQFAEINFIDGAQLPPTLFGKFDTNNTWVPVPYTGSYGTNGFYLPFNNATTSQTLGYDASLTGTTTYDVDQDPYRGSVALHLTGNGPAGGNNNVFADSGPNNYAVTRNGIVTQGSFSPFPLNTNTPYNPAQHGASMYQAAVDSDFPSFPTGSQGSNFTFAGDFTIEGWVYYTSASSGDTSFYVSTQDGSSYLALNISMTAGNYNIYLNSGATAIAHGITANAWTHVAMVRSGSTVTLYTNGVSKGTLTNSSTLGYSTLTMNRCGGGVGGVTRYMSSFRIVKAAIYTAAFTPANRPFGTLTNNLLTFSEDFNNAYWTQGSVTVTPSAAVAPDGNPSATKLTASSTGSIAPQIYKYPNPNLSNSTTYTLSVYAKAAEYNYIVLNNNDGLGSYRTWFNLTTGTVGTNASGNTASMVSVGNGWYRCIVYRTMAASSAANSLQGIQIANADTADTFSATAGSGIYIWGAQIEQGTSATNYTPTPANFSTAPSLLLNFANAAVTDSAGTRNFVTTTNASITASSKYGQGALYFDGSASTFLSTPYSDGFSIGASDYTVEFWCNLSAYGEIVGAFNLTSPYPGWLVNVGNFGTAGKIGFFHANATVSQTVNSTNTVPLNTWTHIAVVKQNNFLKMFINGQLDSSHSLTLTSTGSGQQINIGSDANSLTAPGRRITGSLDDLRITKGVARYTSDFAPPARALPETGGKSFVTTNVNAGVVQRFTTVGTTAWTAPTDVTSVEVLVVAGGGGGGAYVGGGGGAGGLIYNNSYPVTPGQTYTVTVGAGGVASGASASRGTNGSNSVFGNLTAIGGGGGASLTAQGGSAGGSGGGDSHAGQTAGAGTAGQGFAGGRAVTSAYDEAGGGGGGAGAVGIAAVGSATTSLTIAGIGGPGLAFGISGSSTFYAGGGAGGVMRGSARQLGGAGGGGNGAGNGTNATSATANTGGGGGGGGRADLSPTASYSGGDGGSGVVIVRYTTQSVGNTSDATSDNLVDSPTQYGHDSGLGGEVVGNYATLNPLVPNRNGSSYTFSNGNLTATNGTGWCIIPATIYTLGGKWYWEYTIHTSPYNILGFVYDNWVGSETSVSHLGYYNPLAGYGYAGHSQSYYYNSTSTAYGALFGAGDIIGVALDMIAGTLTFYKNGASQGTITGIDTTKRFAPAISLYTSSASMNLGQRAWAYAPPAGFTALTTKNFARLTADTPAANPNQYFDTVLYTGTGATQTITMPGGFTPDFVWIKRRNSANSHLLADIVRGSTKVLLSNDTGAELTDANYTTFVSGGFSVSSNYNEINNSSAPYVAWCWRAGGAPVSNTSGTITSQVSANTASGFSIVTWTGSANGVGTMGHGLGTAPKLIITKQRNQTGAWYTYTTAIDGTNKFLLLNTTATAGSTGVALPTSTVFSNDSWTATYNMIAYCWAEVAGFSKIGTWTNNNSNDGTFVYLGFKPAFVMLKNTDNVETWYIIDAKRPGYNVAAGSGSFLVPNSSGAEGVGNAGTATVDFVSNGFKIRTSNPASGEISFGTRNYIYMAFAEAPFGNVNGVAR